MQGSSATSTSPSASESDFDGRLKAAWEATGSVIETARRVQISQSEARRLLTELHLIWSKSLHLTDREQAQTFETFDERSESAAKAKERLMGDPMRSRWLWGPQGTGKTHLTVALAKLIIESHGATVVRWKFSHFMNRVRIEERESVSSRTLEAAKAVRVLVVDDLDKRRPTPYAIDTLFDLADARYDLKTGVTLLTSNARPSELAETFGGPTMDRLANLCEQIELTDDSYRLFGGDES